MGRCAMTFPPPHWDEYQKRRIEIAGMLDARCYSIGWLDSQILNGDALVFASEGGVIVVTVKRYPAGATELHGLVATGSLPAVVTLIEEAEQWATLAGVDFACVESRPGWERILKKRGYQLHQVSVRKDL